MSFLCVFFPHKWIHIFDTFKVPSFNTEVGIWQCERCKRISVGRKKEIGDLIRKKES